MAVAWDSHADTVSYRILVLFLLMSSGTGEPFILNWFELQNTDMISAKEKTMLYFVSASKVPTVGCAVVEIGEIYGPNYAICFLKTLQYQHERL